MDNRKNDDKNLNNGGNNFFNKYNTNLIYSHSLGVEPNCSKEEGRAILLNRLNTFLVGCTGVAVEIVDIYETLLNLDIIPVIPSFIFKFLDFQIILFHIQS